MKKSRIATWSVLSVVLCAVCITACKQDARIAALSTFTGEQVFQRCISCHSNKDVDRPSGPSLYGLMNRRAAIRKDFYYSESLRRANLTWNTATLDAYLANPQKAVPGTFMIFSVPDATERQRLIEYLQQLQ